MPDTAARSRIMSAIRKRDTKPELRVRRFLHAKGFRYLLHGRQPGNPDLLFPSRRAAVFVHGCFWHRCPSCAAGSKQVRTNVSYWQPKLARNAARDAKVKAELEADGWTVLVIWECEVADNANLERLAGALAKLTKVRRPSVVPRAQPPRARPQRHASARG